MPAVSDEFDSSKLGLQWQWQANAQITWYSLTARLGSIRLFAVTTPQTTEYDHAPHLLLQKFPAPSFAVTTLVDFSESREGDEAGLMVFGSSHAWIGLRRTPTGLYLVQVAHSDAHQASRPLEPDPITAPSQQIFLRVTVSAQARCRFAFSSDGYTFTSFGSEFQATAGKWVGAKVGLFASARSGHATSGHADFDFFRVTG